MKINTIFNAFVPKEPKFFPLMEQLSLVISQVADLLYEGINHYNANTSIDDYIKIKELEREGDVIAHKIFDELHVTFITPFDREDIHNLASKLDDVTDVINRCAQSIAYYKPKTMPESIQVFTELIKEDARVIVEAISNLHSLKKNPKYFHDCCQKLHEIENKADDMYQSFIMQLFENEKDSIELIKLKEIVRSLEEATDEADHVGKIIKTISVKYA